MDGFLKKNKIKIAHSSLSVPCLDQRLPLNLMGKTFKTSDLDIWLICLIISKKSQLEVIIYFLLGLSLNRFNARLNDVFY